LKQCISHDKVLRAHTQTSRCFRIQTTHFVSKNRHQQEEQAQQKMKRPATPLIGQAVFPATKCGGGGVGRLATPGTMAGGVRAGVIMTIAFSITLVEIM